MLQGTAQLRGMRPFRVLAVLSLLLGARAVGVGRDPCKDIGPGWVACGVLGGGPRAWECVYAARDIESC